MAKYKKMVKIIKTTIGALTVSILLLSTSTSTVNACTGIRLSAGLFYHPGFAKYPKYDPAKADITITAIDVVHFILTQFASVDEALDFTALGAGSGMIGLPGDFTPPSRFVRATAFSQTARHTQSSGETVYELFRILDNFNIGVGSAERSNASHGDKNKLRSATL